MTSDVFFDRIQHQFNTKLPFVVYRKPQEALVKVAFQKNDTVHYVKDFSETGFVIAPFDDSKKAIFIPFDDFISETISLENNRSEIKNKVALSEDITQKKNQLALVNKAIEATKSGSLQKVIASRKEIVNLDDTNPINTFKRLLETYSTAFVYCWYHPKVGLWLGASPETLLRVEGNRFTTMALAGTKDFNGTLDVVWGQKEREEHQLVVDFIIDKLKLFSNQIKTYKTETVKAGNILHLKTKITGIFNKKVEQIIKALHPTPAVCGQPKEKAKQFILDYENYNREFYTGYLGELNLKQKTLRNSNRKNIENKAYSIVKNVSNLYVNLRCMQFKNNQAIIYVGGGITKDSIAEDEWDETVSKTLVMKKVL